MKWFACLANSTGAVVAFLVGGCATITTGTTQSLPSRRTLRGPIAH